MKKFKKTIFLFSMMLCFLFSANAVVGQSYVAMTEALPLLLNELEVMELAHPTGPISTPSSVDAGAKAREYQKIQDDEYKALRRPFIMEVMKNMKRLGGIGQAIDAAHSRMSNYFTATNELEALNDLKLEIQTLLSN